MRSSRIYLKHRVDLSQTKPFEEDFMDHKRTTIIVKRSDSEDLKGALQAQPIRAKDPLTVVIFGASGDLTERKLIPALYRLQSDGFMPERYAVIGFSRTPMSDEAFREKMTGALHENLGKDAPDNLAESPLIKSLYYVAGDNDDPASFARLREKLSELDKALKLPGNRLFYLSVSPKFFPLIIKQLGQANLITPRRGEPWTRVIIEKPFGRDLESARKLNDEITEVLDESQIYRIDHYLGKETVQNILSFRFGNSIFEPLFNQKYVEHVQITVAEPLGMEGKRGAYYDTAGATRDMFENHVLQLLTLVAMEPPPALDASSIRDAKVMLLRSLAPFTVKDAEAFTVRGQYGPGEKDGQPVKGYRQEENVAPNSLTETYVALKLKIDNWRWAGVPFYVRTGKRLAARLSEIVVTFKPPPMQLFEKIRESDYCLAGGQPIPNQLILRIQPDEGISLTFACKQPGLKMLLEEVDMDFLYKQAFKQRLPEAYERLLLDVLRGDASLFMRSDEVYQAWSFVTSILQAWSKLPPPVFPNYAPFSEGPREAAKLFGCWRPIVNPEA
jgi:glucose-6-phosphate 1-dehydrogenase